MGEFHDQQQIMTLRMKNRHTFIPQKKIIGYQGYAPSLCPQGALKPPIFQTSTFYVFENAQQGKDFFDFTSRRRQMPVHDPPVWSLSASAHPQYGDIGRPASNLWTELASSRGSGSNGHDLHSAFLQAGRHGAAQPPALSRRPNLLKNQMRASGISAFSFTNRIDGRADPRPPPRSV